MRLDQVEIAPQAHFQGAWLACRCWRGGWLICWRANPLALRGGLLCWRFSSFSGWQITIGDGCQGRDGPPDGGGKGQMDALRGLVPALNAVRAKRHHDAA